MAEREGHAHGTFQSSAEHALVERIDAAMHSWVNQSSIRGGFYPHPRGAARHASGNFDPVYRMHFSNVHARTIPAPAVFFRRRKRRDRGLWHGQ